MPVWLTALGEVEGLRSDHFLISGHSSSFAYLFCDTLKETGTKVHKSDVLTLLPMLEGG